MSIPMPRVSIIIPCRNERHHIGACLRSILSQAEPPGGLEIVIADGMSDDGTREVIRRISAAEPRVHMIDNLRRITPAGLNASIRAARGEIIVRMDAHSEYAPDYVMQCVAILEQTGADNVGGPPHVKADGYVQRAIGAAFHSPFSTGGGRFHQREYEGDVDTIHFGCWQKSKLLELGVFDEELIRNQDDELNFRLKARGGRLWQSPAIRSWYRPRRSLAALFKQYLQYGFWKVRVIQKHGRPASPRQLMPVVFVLGLAFGWLAGFADPTLWIAYAAVVSTYAFVSVVFSARASAEAGWDLFPILPAVFFVYQASYGIGFAAGLMYFPFLRPRDLSSSSGLAPYQAAK